MAAAFSNRLNRHGSARFVPYGRGNGLPVLKIYIEQFQGSFQGHTLVSGYAQWPNGRTTPFNIQTPQQGDGYPRHGGIPVPRPQPRCRYRGRALNIPPQASTKAT